MIPQSFKDIISNVENAGLWQTLALIVFFITFAGILYYVFSKPKKYFEEQENAPLDDSEPESEEDNNKTL